ncbi:MAG: hypothetical protein HN712_02210 [Gemmatimonadetes bacterium]|jgi:L-alanine-DL-glutamate epimerase-like enolase superfamily enzyme|nr:hypothetical protein [Gemmatimonadota bacterium]MBT7859089.1 hypothetical protein [Gemmatimonadota bacterium]
MAEGELARTVADSREHTKITAIKAMQLDKHPQTLIKVETDAGWVGYGEAGTHGPIVRAHLEKEVIPLLLGQDPLEIDKHFSRMTEIQHPNLPNMPTVSGVDIATLRRRCATLWPPNLELVRVSSSKRWAWNR